MNWIKPWFYGSVSKEHRGFLFLGQFALLKQSIFFFDELKFNASSGRLTRSKQRLGIRQITVQSEKLSRDGPAADESENELQKLIENEGFVPEQIFNTDETGLYWKCLPKKTLAYETETSAAGHRAKKQSLTVSGCRNAAGAFFMKPRVIETAKTPRAFSEIEIYNLPVHYYHNKSAWMDRDIFRD
jgi:hypothetical protein